MKTCRWCENMYTPRQYCQIYCSNECKLRAKRFEYWDLKKAGLCVTCGVPVYDDYVRCSGCRDDQMRSKMKYEQQVAE